MKFALLLTWQKIRLEDLGLGEARLCPDFVFVHYEHPIDSVLKSGRVRYCCY